MEGKRFKRAERQGGCGQGKRGERSGGEGDTVAKRGSAAKSKESHRRGQRKDPEDRGAWDPEPAKDGDKRFQEPPPDPL